MISWGSLMRSVETDVRSEQLRCSMTRLNCLYPGLALTTLAALCLAIRVVAAGAAGPGQGRHLGEEKKSHSDEGEQGEQARGKGHRGYRFEAREREIISGYY